MDYLTDYLSHSAASSLSPRVLESVVSYGTSSSEIIGSVLLYLCSTLSAAGGVGTYFSYSVSIEIYGLRIIVSSMQ